MSYAYITYNQLYNNIVKIKDKIFMITDISIQLH